MSGIQKTPVAPSAIQTPDPGTMTFFIDANDGNRPKLMDETRTLFDFPVGAHAASHIRGQSDVIDADRLDITFNPPNYTRDATPSEVTNVEELTAHLKGISDALGVKASNAHAATHIQGGSDEIDGDKIDIDFTPINYTPNTAPPEVDNVDQLSAHLRGISDALAAVGPFNPVTSMQLYDDFVSGTEDSDEIGAYSWRSSVSGSGAESIRAPGTVAHPGVFRISTGTAANAQSSLMLGTQARQPIVVGGGLLTYRSFITFRSADFSANEGFQFGLGDAVEGVGISNSDGIYFEKLGGDTNLFLVCRSSNVETRVDTGQGLSDGLGLRLEIEINAAGTSVQAKINGTNVGAAITTNIPSVPIGPFYKCDGDSGGSNTQLDIDYFFLNQILTTAR